MKNIKQLLFSALVLTSAIVIATSCGKADLASPSAEARIKIFHSVTDAPATGVDIFVDDQLVDLNKTVTATVGGLTGSVPVRDTFFYGRQYPSDSTYMGLKGGEHSIKLTAYGTKTPAVLDTKTTVESGKSYTVFVSDTLNKVIPVVIKDELPPPVHKKSGFRFIHMSPDAPAVDVYRIRGTDTVSLFTNITYKSATAFTQVDTSVGTTGTFKTDYVVRQAGTTKVLRAFTAAVLANGRIYSLVLRGFVGRTGTQAINATLMTNAR